MDDDTEQKDIDQNIEVEEAPEMVSEVAEIADEPAETAEPLNDTELAKAEAAVEEVLSMASDHPIDDTLAPIVDEMKKSYLNYAMSVIVQRALPDVRDGLKPVHRRILYAMHKIGLNHKARFSKSASVVGEVLGKYHPHGDSAVYDALVRMAQTFSLRYPLVLGQGNFGSIDGDPPAAMRYTESKMTAIASEMLEDIEKETVHFRDNFDGKLQEPAFLPAKLPNLLLMGAEGIAVGMATKIPPHNLTEVVDGIIRMIDEVKQEPEAGSKTSPSTENVMSEESTNEDSSSISYTSPIDETIRQQVNFNTSLASLMEHIKGPDFPTAGNIYGLDEIQRAYATGKGKIMMRATVNHEETNRGREAIIVTELPYQTNKAMLVKKIADLVMEKKVLGIADLRDESDRDGIRVVIELKRDAVYKKLLNNLYKHTELQSSYPVNMVALVGNTPQTVSLKTILEQYVKHRVKVIANKSVFELNRAKARAHILEGLLKALDHIDEIITIIKKAKNESEAKATLMSTFDFSDLQAQAILDMQLKRLTGLERAKLEEELKALRDQIMQLETLLKDVFKIIKVIRDELLDLRERYGDERRTQVFKNRPGEFSDEQLIENKEVIVTLTSSGYIKHVPRNTFKVQHRGGKGVSGFETREEDNVYLISAAMSHDTILYFTDAGKVYKTRVWDIPEGSRTSKGKAIVNVLAMQPDEKVTSMLIFNEADKSIENQCIFMCTRLGTVKKTELKEFANIRTSGIIAIGLTADDKLLWARMSQAGMKVILATKHGKSIVFKHDDVRPTGRSSQGVIGIRMEKSDAITSMDVFTEEEADNCLIVLSEKGIGKKTKIKLFPVQKRGGKGVKIANVDAKTGDIAFSSMEDHTKESVVITSLSGQVVKIELKSIPMLSRAAKGVILMRFNKKDDAVASATFL